MIELTKRKNSFKHSIVSYCSSCSVLGVSPLPSAAMNRTQVMGYKAAAVQNHAEKHSRIRCHQLCYVSKGCSNKIMIGKNDCRRHLASPFRDTRDAWNGQHSAKARRQTVVDVNRPKTLTGLRHTIPSASNHLRVDKV